MNSSKNPGAWPPAAREDATVLREDYDSMPAGKRALDLLLCALGLPLLCLATLIMAALVRVTSPGPVFFRQERVGYRGRRFTCYKFRTMKVGATRGATKPTWTRC